MTHLGILIPKLEKITVLKIQVECTTMAEQTNNRRRFMCSYDTKHTFWTCLSSKLYLMVSIPFMRTVNCFSHHNWNALNSGVSNNNSNGSKTHAQLSQ